MEKSAPSDPELLADWLSQQREPAFHALVARYAGLVHATAKRTCYDDSMAAEASQLTFIALAQKAKKLTSCASLGGWLHTTAMMQAKNLLRKSQRENRKRQLLQAAMETEPIHSSNGIWQEMQPVLDDALAALSDKDREALLLRFYRSLSIREIAATLGIATDAAQKRLDRAIERLRGKLARRGVQAGGSLGAAMLAGFAADAQAALPISILASKAIAAGAVSTFSLSAMIAAIALMKTSSLVPPAVALILAGAWTGTKYQALSATEARNGLFRDEIAAARSVKTPAPVKLTKDDGPIDWQKLATEGDNGPEMQRFQKRLKSMTREEMIAALDQIAALDLSKNRRGALEWTVVDPLMEIDPEWVLNHFADRLRDDPNQQHLPLLGAFKIWAKRDLVKATAWFDRQIAAGAFDGRALDHISGSKARFSFEAALLDVLLAFDSVSAGRRLGAMPETERMEVMDRFTGRLRNQRLEERHHMAEFADLVRNQLPGGQQVAVLFQGAPYSRVLEDYPVFAAYLEKIEATPGERMTCTEKFAGANINWISQHRKVSQQDIDAVRGWFREISPDSVDSCTGRALTEAMSNRVTSMRLAQASEIAVELLEAEGAAEVLATLLETTELDKPEVKLALELTRRIPDETRRTAVVKHLESLTFPW